MIQILHRGMGDSEAWVSSQSENNHSLLNILATAPSNGYALVYLANESSSDVYFDSLSLSRSALSYQENHYDPWGMNLVGIERSGVPDHKYLYNGKELQQETDLYDYGWRNYDAVLGRFHSIDAFADKYYSLTPYQYGTNNPIKYIDINGDSLMLFKNGVYVTTVDNGKKEITGFSTHECMVVC